MSFKIRDIDPKKISENLMDKYVDFIFKLHMEKNPKDPFPEKEILLKRMKVEDKRKLEYGKQFFQIKKMKWLHDLYCFTITRVITNSKRINIYSKWILIF